MTALINLVIEVALIIVLDPARASALSTVIAQWCGALVYVALAGAEARRHQVGSPTSGAHRHPAAGGGQR